MRVLVVYESVFGSTAEVARAIGQGLGRHCEVTVADVRGARPEYAERFDLLVVGAPTHAFSMARGFTHADAVHLGISDGRREIGLRDWLRMLPEGTRSEPVATFDTRVREGRRFSGSAARRAAHVLRHLGYLPVAEPTSFYVRKITGPLLVGERARAVAWGDRLGALLVATSRRPNHSP